MKYANQLNATVMQRLAAMLDRSDPPSDGELWDSERLYGHGLLLGELAEPTTRAARRVDVKARLKSNARALQSAYRSIVAALQAGRSISPAAEWIVDNFHVVSEQMSDAPVRLTPRIWRNLPASARLDEAAWPRIYVLATEYLQRTLWEFQPASLLRMLEGYQQGEPLSMSELWALYPILRIALIDELRRVAVRLEDSLAARATADALADALVETGAPPPGQSESMPWLDNPLPPPFTVQLVHRLHGIGERGRPLLDALARALGVQGTNVDECIQRQHARRSANNVAARNIITSLRALASYDWRLMFEKASLVERLLRERPDYVACDRRTRDRYRQAIEVLAQGTDQHEMEITRRTLALLGRLPASGAESDLGAWLIGSRRTALEDALDCPVSPAQRLRRSAIDNARILYLGGIALLTGLLVWAMLHFGIKSPAPPALLVLAVLLAALPASELAIGILNRIWLRAFPPRHLPRLALEAGLGPAQRTLVVVPTMLRSPECVAEACRQLHVHALANPDPQVFFALLSDWTDSTSAHRAGDEEVLAMARDGISGLNAAESGDGATEPRFFLLHRRRQWCATERCYTGWERKRGKLAELNRLLLGAGATSFMADESGSVPFPQDIRYVLTVDSDTRLPLGCVRDLVGVAAHPLNLPVVDPQQHRVVRGYGVLQPRITPLLPATDERSLYREIVTSGSGIDPYAAAVSDLYQDVFGEGVFTGKGLYDLAAWEAAMQGRVPPESLLSHDLFEGIFARCGLVSDFEFFEDFPSNSEVAAARSHRWMRGDWQLLPWVLGRHGSLPPLGRWKMLDNLRRALLAPGSMVLLIVACASAGLSLRACLALVLAPLVWPAIATAVERLFAAPAARSRRMHLYRLAADFAGDLGRAGVWLAMLAQNSWLAIDAMARALFRVTVSRRHLLEWVTAAQLKTRSGTALESFVWPLKSASIVVVTAAALLVVMNPAGLPSFAPFLVLWWLSPLLAQWLSRPLDAHRPNDALPEAVDRELRGTARLTWTFFETFVTAEENFLPPDNFQEDPAPVIAHRSSPTNFGMYLLSIIAARDFGWLGLGDTSTRLAATLATLQRMKRFQGHFLNWYDTRTLAPLAPEYVSTVDSGNLAGHLLALRQACIAMRAGPLLSQRALSATLDGAWLAWQALNPTAAASGAEEPARSRRDRLALMSSALARLETTLGAGAATLGEAQRKLQWASDTLDELLEAGATWLPPRALRALELARRDAGSHLQDLRWVLSASSPRAAAIAALPVSASIAEITAACDSDGTHGALAPLVALCRSLEEVAAHCEQLVAPMSFGFLFDRRRGLFSIGYRIAESAIDEGYYDLLASEARLASLVAIAKGEAPRSHWFRLGRRLTGGSTRPVLASWSGSMFEYLMPALVMQEPRFSLLDQTNRRVVRQQIRYGGRHGLPWGVSESAYNVRDREYTYQYSGFGVPALGLKRGLSSDYVVAPYATALAAMYMPVEANANLRELALAGAYGTYGFYEALDYTPSRVPEGQAVAVVRAHMAHHQGMSLVALDNALHDCIMQARFHAEPRIAAADLLLQERRIRFVEAPAFVANVPASRTVDEPSDVTRIVEGVNAPTPVTHLLSNRRYTVMLTDSGAGYSSCGPRAVTRWRADATRDCWGSFIYLSEQHEHRVWSAGFQPTAAPAENYRAHFSEECCVFERRDDAVRTTMTVVVAADDDGELRQVTLHNDGTRVRDIEVTSYAEIVLAPPQADLAHPGFSNLFVQTEYVPEYGALLASRRPRSSRESIVWAAHVVADAGTAKRRAQFDTDRARFIGRGRSVRQPQAMDDGRALGNSAGNVLDPVFSLRTSVSVPARGRARVTFATFVGKSRDEVLALVARYRNPALFDHVLQSTWTFARTELHYLGSNLGEARLFQTLAAHLLLGTAQLRAADTTGWEMPDVTHLWRHSISGDRPILLIRCHSMEELGFIRQCLRAQEYLRIKRLAIDVVVLNERPHSYMQELQQSILHTAADFRGGETEGELRGGIYVLAIDALAEGERQLLLSLARVVLNPSLGSLRELLSRPTVTRSAGPPPLPPVPTPLLPPPVAARSEQSDLDYFNGWGGFRRDSGEYTVLLSPAMPATPAPWSNVVANESFGSLITERGSMCTWSLNSRENQLTPWSNDAVVDPSGECFYLLDEDAELWSPAPQPVRRPEARHEVRHGQGYSCFEVAVRGIESQLTVFVAGEDPVKLCHLRLRNTLPVRRRLLVASYVEWTLGAARAASNHNIRTERDEITGAQFARNPALIDFGGRVAFCDFGGRQRFSSASRHEFLGRNGSTELPAGLRSPSRWTDTSRAGTDPCCAFAFEIELAPDAVEEITFVLGQGLNREQARQLVLKYRALPAADVLREVRARWNALLDKVRIRTPDRALDLLFNRWLLYQTTACRLWGRAAFYQAGGAYGFRDQLQDVMALILSAPGQARAQLLRAASRQFVEGDVQHWWHPPSGRGVRTHISDDLLFLPYVTSHYLQGTGDRAVLDEIVGFIEGPPLAADQEDAHYVPATSTVRASLYEHCVRALEHSLPTGAHGLPLMGGGDWNDGMNRVGHEGRGESVWLAWFLITTLQEFMPIASSRGDDARVARWREHCASLASACEREAWDGAWYRRAFFDDGTPLGSAANEECRIDSIAQSWAVLSGAADPERAAMAMTSVEQYLVQGEQGLVLLFTPPFDDAPVDPGYIKGYAPGLRENGGQYTHASIWVLMAQARRGNVLEVARLLRMLNPVHRSASTEGARRYRVEPYVLAADIYSGAGVAGRGGWTWYTGAAGWMYRAILESVLGIRIRGDELLINPCLPDHWPGFEVELDLPGCFYLVRVERGSSAQLLLDGERIAGPAVPLLRDNKRHTVELGLP